MKAFIVMALLAVALGSPREQQACLPDVMRLCQHALASGPFTVEQCLAANRARLSAACRKVLREHGK